MKIERGTILYVFKHDNDTWVKELRGYLCGALGWDPEEWEYAWIEVETKMPSLFGQLMTVYRYMGLTPREAVTEFVRHPDFRYLELEWKRWLEWERDRS